MEYVGLDHVILPAASPAGLAPFERLGLRLTPPLPLANIGIERRNIATGGRTNMFIISLDSVVDQSKASPSVLGSLTRRAGAGATGICALALRVPSVPEAVNELAGRGIETTAEAVLGADGARLGSVAVLPGRQEASATLLLVDSVVAPAEWHDELEREGMLAHSLKLKRLDHLAAAAPNLEETTRFWVDVLGIPVWGEIVTATTVIRQMKIGDAILELLGPAGPDSPLRSRPPGLSSMTAFEVPELEAAVATARAAGFTISDPATGTLPGTRVARIPAGELSGLGLQLLQYV